jgi:hypothetical protein
MPKQIGWSTEAYLLSQIKSLLAKVGSMSSGGITSLNGLTDASQTFAVGTAGAGFSISSAGGVHTFNIPNASATAKGLLTAVDWSTFNNKMEGTGTTNYVAKFTGTTALGNSLIFDNGTFVGIGTNVPIRQLSVYRTSSDISSGAFLLDGNGSYAGVQFARNGNINSYIASDANVLYMGHTSNLAFRTGGIGNNVGGTDRMFIDSSGRVGIGTGSPIANLEIFAPVGTKGTSGDTNGAYCIIQGGTRTGTSLIGGSFSTTLILASNENTISAGNGASVGFYSKWSSGAYASLAQFASIFGGKENSTNDNLAGYLSIATRASVGTSTERMRITSGGNVGIEQTTFGTNATKTLAISTGVAPTTSPADCFQMYSADVVAGNAAPHIRTENGAVVKVYQETTGVAAATLVSNAGTAITSTDTFDGYTLRQIVKALRNQGLLA